MNLRSATIALLLALASTPAGAQMYKGVELVKAELITDTPAVSAGKPFTVGLRMKMAPHWHTYWEYSGDAGLPTKINWKLPDGFKAGPIQWPVPERIDSPGDIVNYGYSNEVILLTEITPPAKLPAGQLQIGAAADWLVCADLCVPGKAELQLSFEGSPANAEAIQHYRALLPEMPGTDGKFGAGIGYSKEAKGGATVSLTGPPGSFPSAPEFFPLTSAGEIGHPGAVVRDADGSGVHVTTPVESGSAEVGGVFAFHGGKAYYVPASAAKLAAPLAKAASPGKAPAGPVGSIWHFLLLGFLGGVILNVMPCVLPVISLKLFSFVKQANESPARVLRLGLAYAAGVFTWFLGFAAAIVILKRIGRQVGYSFLLQSPWFLVTLSAVTFVFALNLLGVFEIILPGSVTNAAAGASERRGGYSGAFLQGVLATVLGSACMAPFFGEALAFAFSQGDVAIFAMFAAIAAGLSTPFVLLSAQPGWLKFLPKPGVWMERVKQGTGFLLLATVLWLLYVLGRSKGSDGVVWTGVLLLALGAACWVQGAFNTLMASDRTRWAARAAIGLLAIGGAWFCFGQIAEARPPEGGTAHFGAQLDTALKSGHTVFVDFTADWCTICKSNERFVLATDPVQKALRDGNVMYLKADYTVASDDVDRLLKQFNTVSVPLYVIYPAGRTDAPVVLPTLLTEQIVLDALKSAANGQTLAAVR